MKVISVYGTWKYTRRSIKRWRGNANYENTNNMAWLLKCIKEGEKAGISLPKNEDVIRTNFIR